MDNKVIIEKALKGEDYSVEVKDFTDEQKTKLSLEIRNAAEASSKEELDKVAALRKEKQRLEEKPLEPPKKPDVPPADDKMKQFRDEQVIKAKGLFFTQFKLDDAQKAALEAEFTRLDTGKMDADLILGDLKRAYAVINADALIDTQQKFNKGMTEAERRNAMMVDQSGINSPENDKFSPEAKKLYMEWQKAGIIGPTYSLEAAQRVVSSGNSRQLPA